jgi:glycosyltransferase involved in cell wall biosynthesis
MRVLIISRQFPWPQNSGGSQRIFHFIHGLSRQHQVTFLILTAKTLPANDLEALRSASGCEAVVALDGTDCAFFDQSLHWSNAATFARLLLASRFPILIHDWWSKTLMRTLAKFFAEGSFDLIVTREPAFAEQARSVGFPRIVLDVDDLFSVLLTQQLANAGWYRRKLLHQLDVAKARIYERTLPRRFERVVLAKEADRRLFDANLQSRLVVIPNGVSLPPLLGHNCEQPNRLLFVGTLSYGPNEDAIRYLAREVLPILWKECPDVSLDVVGRGPADRTVIEALSDPRCRLHQSAPDLNPFYREATLVVAPVRHGSGTRIKVLEALAYQKALVATSFAPEGLGLEPGKHFVSADSASEFAHACAELLVDESRRRALGSAGRDFVARRFDWDHIEETISELADSPTRDSRSREP